MTSLNKDVKNSIVNVCKTAQGVLKFIEALDMASSGLYKNQDFRQFLSESIELRFSEFILESLASHNLKLEDKTTVKTFLTDLKNEARSIHQIKLILAFNPTAKFIDMLFSWVSTNVDPDIVINYEVNKDIIGGATVIYKGKYLDFSSAPNIDKVFVERESYVQELLS